ncbi:MAG: YvcK family protein [Firmicutes bacterium]|nr:YvcK family protein [Bacillota bacterium]MBQ1401537.1 YvcK family protein [Bacillota bacterium]
MKKIAVLGGGRGLSRILSGLKLFPVDVTAIITVSDDGSSTGVLKEELNIPAVGDLGKVLISMANVGEDDIDLLSYRFEKDGTLHNHPVRNILLAALIDLKGSLTEAAKYMSRLLNIKGTVLPLSEDKVELIGRRKGDDIVGEVAVSKNVRDIDYLAYDHPIEVGQEVIDEIMAADLIVLSPGSLYTSILPHLIAPGVHDALEQTDAPIMYIANVVTQPGETDGYSLSDHISVLNKYLGSHKVDIVAANNGVIGAEVSDVYRTKERKLIVEMDVEKTRELGARVIEADMVTIDEKGSITHDDLKTAYQVFSYLMGQDM